MRPSLILILACPSHAFPRLVASGDAKDDDHRICADKDENCAGWAATGECEANPSFMLASCADSCTHCRQGRPGEMRSREERLKRRDNACDDLDDDCEARAAAGACHDGSDGLVRCPSSCRVCRFKRVVGEAFDCGSFSSQGSARRPALCVEEEVPHERYFEPFQILRYEPGQFYRVHHDQNCGLFTPQGARVYTFFMYLSTPERGGGTRFADIDETVPAVKGSAVLWPSVRNDDPDEDEPRTHHEGLPPDVGVKYAANVWVHNYDYRTPSANGCPFCYKNTRTKKIL
ncbi:hypothetical protein EMIHUDRAFT_222496 [Emiliania huxleyi CCMP1516]|uniref:Fe2OG dioxygenase domain-containing protein n=2 Tax=Emiliania huxleyi TaxID=2903 RepID=A0A0D3KY98_EMIH1|nr:hypothetical protein EMIHUDRAFT_222496 [Emiliania huxleyi CCMP1516]EOD40733.1 hypothetical protein EMIHUDRAFT_222496 [Emiliania huxleyi CCMP1516]|eukprot:XP_005793162.1 hypothetical protein EMIHUDRAFT_222496 [Emiliania huxleyi CCMP1516]